MLTHYVHLVDMTGVKDSLCGKSYEPIPKARPINIVVCPRCEEIRKKNNLRSNLEASREAKGGA